MIRFGIKMAVIGSIMRMIYMISLHFALFGEHVLDLKVKKRKVNVIIISSTLVDGIYRAIRIVAIIFCCCGKWDLI